MQLWSIQRLGACLALALLLGCTQPSEPTPARSFSLAITNVTLIDAVNPRRENMTVVLDGDQIVSVSPTAATTVNATQIIDGKGGYLIPGLWDMHVHITYEPVLTDVMPDLFLDYGITSVRDTGGMLPRLLPEINKWRAAGAKAPRVFYSGPLLDGRKVVYDGNDRPQIGIANPNVDTAAQNVQELVDAGVDFIKIYELVSPEVFAALVAQAAIHQLPIAAHVPLALLADTAGPEVDSMEHLRNVELACAENAQALLAERLDILDTADDISGYALRSSLHAAFRPRAFASVEVKSERCTEVLRSLKNTIQVPTLRLNTIVQSSPLEREDWPANLAKIPPALAQQWQQTAQRFLGTASEDSLRMADWSLALVGEMHHLGVPIGAGTDTPIGQAIPGYSLHTELERLVDAGLTPLEALYAATVRPAEFFGLQDTYGQILPGFVGDLVLLHGDPVADVKNTRTVAGVVSKGVAVR